MRVLIACEESQAVTKAFRQRGHEAFSCDVEPCSGGHPEWHMQQDVVPLLTKNWCLIIAFPPCTHLASSGAAHFKKKREDGRQKAGIEFFMKFVTLTIRAPKVVIENPVGVMSTYFRKPDQIINPYEHGDPYSKRTCLWIKGLPKLSPSKMVPCGEYVRHKNGKATPKWYSELVRLPPKERAKARSVTFPGIARAMSEQWG